MAIPRETPSGIDLDEHRRQSRSVEKSSSQHLIAFIGVAELRHDDERRRAMRGRKRRGRAKHLARVADAILDRGVAAIGNEYPGQ